jgi:predicted SAM-dependent methyltransferase
VLNTGSGPVENKRLHVSFERHGWEQIRLDIDPWVKPDLIGSIEDMRGLIPDESFDAVWSSHSLEHLYAHQVLPALSEFRRILKPDGFAMITCPDLEVIAAFLLDHGPEAEAYVSPAGPIAAADMLFGHRASVAAGNQYMAHHTGFTAESLGSFALQAGFSEAHVGKGRAYDLWAIAAMPETDLDALASMLRETNEAFLIQR